MKWGPALVSRGFETRAGILTFRVNVAITHPPATNAGRAHTQLYLEMRKGYCGHDFGRTEWEPKKASTLQPSGPREQRGK